MNKEINNKLLLNKNGWVDKLWVINNKQMDNKQINEYIYINK